MRKSLICITTCKRIDALRAIVWDYLDFCTGNDSFSFLVSLDGDDPNVNAFCKNHNIPVLYSKEREGVGLSKNRVLEAYPEFSYYFFIEDDVVLLNPAVFQIHIDVSENSGIPHFSLFSRDRIIDQDGGTKVGEFDVLHARYGSAQFNFFTRKGIDTVGGFDLSFAKIRRFGHTEHSYRFVNAGLCKYPFNIIDQCIDGYMRWTEPGTVTRVKVQKTENRLYRVEADLIAKKNKWQPAKTLSEYVRPNSLDLDAVRRSRFEEVYRSYYIGKVCLLDGLRFIKRLVRG